MVESDKFISWSQLEAPKLTWTSYQISQLNNQLQSITFVNSAGEPERTRHFLRNVESGQFVDLTKAKEIDLQPSQRSHVSMLRGNFWSLLQVESSSTRTPSSPNSQHVTVQYTIWMMRKRNLIRYKKNGRDKSTLFPPHCTRRRPLNGHWLINRVLWYVNTWKSTTMIHLIPSRAAAVAAAFHTVKWAPINQRIHHRLHWWKRAATASIFQLQRHFSFFFFPSDFYSRTVWNRKASHSN